jgi:hypothetical protein
MEKLSIFIFIAVVQLKGGGGGNWPRFEPGINLGVPGRHYYNLAIRLVTDSITVFPFFGYFSLLSPIFKKAELKLLTN